MSKGQTNVVTHHCPTCRGYLPHAEKCWKTMLPHDPQDAACKDWKRRKHRREKAADVEMEVEVVIQ